MEQIIKAFLGIFIVMIMIFTSIGLMNTSVQAKNADVVLDSLCAAWEASNFMLTEAELSANLPEDYELTTTKKKSASNGNVSYATITLVYKYKVPLLGLNIRRQTSRSLR